MQLFNNPQQYLRMKKCPPCKFHDVKQLFKKNFEKLQQGSSGNCLQRDKNCIKGCIELFEKHMKQISEPVQTFDGLSSARNNPSALPF